MAAAKNTIPKVRFPIGMKLMLIIGLIVIISLGIITYMVNYFDTYDVKRKGESNNFTVNGRSAAAAESFFSQVKSNAFLFMNVASNVGNDESTIQQASAYFFEQNDYTAGIFLVTADEKLDFAIEFPNKKFLNQNELTIEKIHLFIQDEEEFIRKSAEGENFVLNPRPVLECPSLAFLYPWHENGLKQTLVVLTSVDSLSQTFGILSTNVSYIVNMRGDILVHPNDELTKVRANVSKSPIFAQMLEDADSSERQISFTDKDGKEYFGAFKNYLQSDFGVITTIDTQVIYENVVNMTRRNIYFAGSVFFLALLFIWIYSKSITVPLKKLTKASGEVENGNYDIKLI